MHHIADHRQVERRTTGHNIIFDGLLVKAVSNS